MSKYTTEIRFICETFAGLTDSVGYTGINEVIQKAIPKVFDFDFPIYDESYRNVLCTKILKHYYTREIGLETVGLWKLHLDTRLNEIMPYYNQLYRSAMIDFNPMYDIDLTTKYSKKNDGTNDTTNSGTANDIKNGTKNVTNSNSKNSEINSEFTATKTETKDSTIDDSKSVENNGKLDDARNILTDVSNSQTGNSTENRNGNNSNVQRNLYSNTPQGALNNLENETYLTDARKITDSGENSSENTVEYTDTNEGSQTVSDSLARVTTDTSDETYKRIGKDTVAGTNENNGSQTIKDIVSGEADEIFADTLKHSEESTGTTVMTSTEEYLQSVRGKHGGVSYSKLLLEYRSTFINIDKMIIDELADLFMNLW